MDNSYTTEKFKSLNQSSKEVIRCLLKTLFHSEAVKIYNLKPSPLQKGEGGMTGIQTVQHGQKD
jgi:hypothetical protein